MDPIRDEIIQFQSVPKSAIADIGTEPYGLHCPKLKLLNTLLCPGKPERADVRLLLPFAAISQIFIFTQVNLIDQAE